MSDDPQIDIGAECSEVRVAIEGIRVMSDTLAHQGAEDDETALLMPRRMSAMLALVVERLRLLERVLDDSSDPSAMAARHNRPIGIKGIHLRVWSARRLRIEAERALVRQGRPSGRSQK